MDSLSALENILRIPTSLLALFALSLLGCYGDSRSSVTIGLGMAKSEVVSRLTLVGAVDITDGMQRASTNIDGESSNVVQTSKHDVAMWKIDRPEMSLETTFTNGKLTNVNLWRWRNHEMTSNHHAMEYEEVSSISIHPKEDGISATVVRTHNANDG